MKDKLFTVREAAAAYKCHPETIRRWIWSGKLPAQKLGNQLFIHEKDLIKRDLITKYPEQPDTSSFLARAKELQAKIRSRSGKNFDIVALVEETRNVDHEP